MPHPSPIWTDLLVVCAVALLGMSLARMLARRGIPDVTVYLLAGAVLGPNALGVIDAAMLGRSSAIPELLLGFVAFMLGERLTVRTLLAQGRTIPMLAGLAMGLPAVLVASATLYLLNVPVREAIVLGMFAAAGAPATTLALGARVGAKGRTFHALASVSALDNVFVLLLYGIAAPFLTVSVAARWSVWGAFEEIAVTLLVGAVVGYGIGWVMSHLMNSGGERETGQMLAVCVIGVMAAVAASALLGSSALVGCVVAGVTVAYRVSGSASPSPFGALKSIEDLAYVFFFLFAGTEISLSALMIAGPIALVYVVARSIGRIGAGVSSALLHGSSARGGMRLGLALLPQAGVVVGLALDAESRFPHVGEELLTVVMASLVLFEFIGPIVLHRALEYFEASEAGARTCSPSSST